MADQPTSGDAESAGDECPHCGATVEPQRWSPPVERATCYRCGLQVVRRPGERWHGIRG